MFARISILGFQSRALATAAGKAAKKVKAKPEPTKPVRKPNSLLAAVVGNDCKDGKEAVKKVWEYIRSNKLQSSENKKEILCVGDSKFHQLTGKSSVNTTELFGLVWKNMV